jgi:[calcium/calmodulin-dependent protein kinase] kinase
MEPQPPRPPFHRPSHPRLHNILPPAPSHIPHRTASSTPVSSPGLFTPSHPRPNMSFSSQPGSETATPGGLHSPFLHPLQDRKVRE